MVSHADTKATGHPPQQHREQKWLPAEYEQRRESAYVKRGYEEGSNPHDGLRECPVMPEKPWHLHISTLYQSGP
jgi:hypothetical protein